MKNKIFIILVFPLSIFLLWSFVTYSGIVKPFFLPSPSAVWISLTNLFLVHNFANDVTISLIRIILGFFLAAIISIPLGILLGLNKKIEMAIEPSIDFIRYTPLPAFIPLLILWFGIGELEKILVITFSVFFQLVLMIANSVASTPKDMVDFSKTLGLNKLGVIFKIILPYSAPKIFNDLRVSMGWAWSGLILAEIVGSSAGIGYIIIQSQRLLRTADVIGAIFVIGIIGILSDLIIKAINAGLFPWFRKADNETRN